jgi:hypothetical protein
LISVFLLFFRDGDSYDMRKKLPFCVGLLLRLLRKNLRVFVTCTSGFDRSPACVIAYLHWMTDVSLHAAYTWVTGMHTCRPDRLFLLNCKHFCITCLLKVKLLLRHAVWKYTIYKSSFSFEVSGDKLLRVLSQPDEFQWMMIVYQLIFLKHIHYFYFCTCFLLFLFPNDLFLVVIFNSQVLPHFFFWPKYFHTLKSKSSIV